MFKPRPKQEEVLAYVSGMMGVSAVPGSGKTSTLSYLASKLIAGDKLGDKQEVLIVTLVNSAVNNFSRQVGGFIEERGLFRNLGYRVRTLHGLANDIVRERPGLVGLDADFKIVDERETNDILQDAATAWIRTHPDILYEYIESDMPENKVSYLLGNKWPDEVIQISRNFIQQAKDMQMSPEDVRRGLDRFKMPLPLAEMCQAIFINYQRSLSYRGGVDFQDLIVLALRALREDEDYLQRLRTRWPYVLEDEAQDSSKLQEDILRLLVGNNGNWIRVGDPNQAIYETFTTAKPEYLRDFLTEDNVQARTLPNSGRSMQSVIDLANHLIDWTQRHPVQAVQQRQPLAQPYIEPTPPGDPQPNPPDNPLGIYLWAEGYTPQEEIDMVVMSLRRWLPDNQDKTVAVLTPRNDRGANMVKALKLQNIDVVELLRSTSSTRETAGALVFILEALTNPNAAGALAMAYKVWRRDDRDDLEAESRLERTIKALRKCKQVEDYLHPRTATDWMDSGVVSELTQDDDVIHDLLLQFRELMRRWQDAVILPIDQLILTLAQDLFVTAADLAIAHSLALHLRRAGDVNPLWRLPDFAVELKMVAQNKRRIVDLGEDSAGYDPEKHKGKVTVATMHAAKGLEWDRVYLMSVNNYNFPSAAPGDDFIGERWYVRDNLNLQAEALEQLERLADPLPFDYEEGTATINARIEYAAERLRLIYVGITRAKRELVVTWNTGRDGKVTPAAPFVGLQLWWEDNAT
jgi:DNA helicase II / ATP-dependent DNA helicase PcrA